MNKYLYGEPGFLCVASSFLNPGGKGIGPFRFWQLMKVSALLITCYQGMESRHRQWLSVEDHPNLELNPFALNSIQFNLEGVVWKV